MAKKPAKKPVRKPAPAKKPAAKPARKAATKPARKPAAKPARKPAKRPAARRPTPKVSPVRGMSVADWAKKLTPEQAEILDILAELVAREALEATAAIKWAQPVWDLNGPMAYFKPASAHVTFGFWRGAELDDPAGLLEGGDRMKHVKLRKPHEAHKPELADFVRQAAELHRTKK